MRLAADLGGTHARFALDAVTTRVDLAAADYRALDDAVADALTRFGTTARALHAVFAVAGPVHGARAAFTNLAWTVDADALARRFGFATVQLLNDAEAAARAAAHALPDDAMIVQAGPRDPHARHALIGVGTGLGVAFWRGEEIDATEAGHAGFAPAEEWQRDLAIALEHEFGRASWERVLSGPGLARIDAHLRGTAAGEAAVVAARAASGDAVARDALRRFSSLLGAFAGDLVLAAPAAGGVLLAGGVLARVGDLFDAAAFRAGLAAKGRFASRLAALPVWRTADDALALRGALR